MAVRSNASGNTYDIAKDLAQNETELASYCYVLGLDYAANSDTITIDQIVERIRVQYKFNDMVNALSDSLAEAERLPWHAPNYYLRTQHSRITKLVRRRWHWVKMAGG